MSLINRHELGLDNLYALEIDRTDDGYKLHKREVIDVTKVNQAFQELGAAAAIASDIEAPNVQ
ncbi:MAG TPA: hypothetical protein VMR51_00550 [Patescibacteria group bacterium]|nr:hypothetical protein [Patescibacteria group bacterium]